MVTFVDDGDAARLAGDVDAVTDSVRRLTASSAEARQTFQDIGNAGAAFNAALAPSVDKLTNSMSNAFERFARTGKLSFDDLKQSAVSALNSIYSEAVSAGLDSLLAGGSVFGDVFRQVFEPLSFAPRATGGPVAPGRAFLVGESGPEMFIPRSSGRVEPLSARGAGAPIAITINMSGGQPGPQMRQSASQIAAQVGRAVQRAQRNG